MTKRLTRTVHLTEEEAQQLADLAAHAGMQESALLREWVTRGIRESRIERTLDAYDCGYGEPRDAAAIAGLPIGVLVDELAERHIPLLRTTHPAAPRSRNHAARDREPAGYLR